METEAMVPIMAKGDPEETGMGQATATAMEGRAAQEAGRAMEMSAAAPDSPAVVLTAHAPVQIAPQDPGTVQEQMVGMETAQARIAQEVPRRTAPMVQTAVVMDNRLTPTEDQTMGAGIQTVTA